MVTTFHNPTMGGSGGLLRMASVESMRLWAPTVAPVRSKQQRDTRGRVTRIARPVPPASVLLDTLGHIARSAARRAHNDPRTALHVERLVLRWLLDWSPDGRQSVRQYIALKAGNEARRIAALPTGRRTAACARSADGPQLLARVRAGAVRTGT